MAHRLTIRPKNPEHQDYATVHDLEFLLDGKPLRGLRAVEIAPMAAKDFPALMSVKLHLSIVPDFDLPADISAELHELPPQAYEAMRETAEPGA